MCGDKGGVECGEGLKWYKYSALKHEISNENIQNKMKIKKATIRTVFEWHSGICG